MGKRYKEYRKRKERKDKFQMFLGALALLMMLFLVVWFIVNDALAIKHIRNNTLETYTGTYSCELKRTYGKNSHYYYLISLKNGDVLSISEGRLGDEQILKENPVLTFQYTKACREKLFIDAYSVLAIENADEGTVFVQLQESYGNCVNRVRIFSVALSILVLIWISLLFGYYYAVVRDKRMSQRKNQAKS